MDAQIKSNFGHFVNKARHDELYGWATEPESSLALVILPDQFPRNLYRGSSEAFSGDVKASAIAIKAIANDFDSLVTVIQALAFYLALMQQESLISAVAARSLFTALKPRCDNEEENKWVNMGISASKRHVQQLECFGRYPTRNAILGRKNTEAEEEFLKTHMLDI